MTKPRYLHTAQSAFGYGLLPLLLLLLKAEACGTPALAHPFPTFTRSGSLEVRVDPLRLLYHYNIYPLIASFCHAYLHIKPAFDNPQACVSNIAITTYNATTYTPIIMLDVRQL
jgi:hypothetical protein